MFTTHLFFCGACFVELVEHFTRWIIISISRRWRLCPPLLHHKSPNLGWRAAKREKKQQMLFAPLFHGRVTRPPPAGSEPPQARFGQDQRGRPPPQPICLCLLVTYASTSGIRGLTILSWWSRKTVGNYVHIIYWRIRYFNWIFRYPEINGFKAIWVMLFFIFANLFYLAYLMILQSFSVLHEI